MTAARRAPRRAEKTSALAPRGSPGDDPGVLTDFYVRVRTRSPDSPSRDGRLSTPYASLTLGVRGKSERFGGASSVMIRDAALALTIEAGMSIKLGPGRIETETWANGYQAKTFLPSSVEIVPYQGSSSPKIDDLDSATCKSLERRFGPDYPAIITLKPACLDETRFSSVKRRIIVKACAAEAAAEARVEKSERQIIDALIWAKVPKSRARELAARYASVLVHNIYQPLFDGALSFLKADRFVQRLDPAAAERDRPQALVYAALRTLAKDQGDTIAINAELAKLAWRDFALIGPAFDGALQALIAKGVVEKVTLPDASPAACGLTSLINAERFIAHHVEKAFAAPFAGDAPVTIGGRDFSRTAVIEGTIARAPKYRGFALDADQADALRNIFAHRLSIITGPPGSGKTAIIALANRVAHTLYGPSTNSEQDGREPIMGVALAGRAAATLADAASLNIGDALLSFPAATIHRTFGLAADIDEIEEQPQGNKRVAPAVLIIDEASMVSAPLLALILRNTAAEHIVLGGDIDQLTPIGAGAPFADLIAGGRVPVARLKGNYRTDDRDIRQFCAYVQDGLDGYDPGDNNYLEARSRERGASAGECWQALRGQGVSDHDIAAITPQKIGDDGAKALNLAIRSTLGIGSRLEIGDLLIVTKNNYKALTPSDDETEEIFNGERCVIVKLAEDFVDAEFPASLRHDSRLVRFLCDGAFPPDGTEFGYALTAHKAQGSQFDHVILVTSPNTYFQSRPSVYTAASRARKSLTIIGDWRELKKVIDRDPRQRHTLLRLHSPSRDGRLSTPYGGGK